MYKVKVMSFKDTYERLVGGDTTPAVKPLCSKRLVVENLLQIKKLMEEGFPLMAQERIGFLIKDIELGNLDGGKL